MIPTKVIYNLYSKSGTLLAQREHIIDSPDEFTRVMETVAREWDHYEILKFEYKWQEDNARREAASKLGRLHLN